MEKVLLLLLCVVISGCATVKRYEAKLNTWIGASENALIAAWGVPDKEYRMGDGKKAIAYVHKNTVQTGGFIRTEPQTTVHSGTIGGAAYSGISTTYVTETMPAQNYKLSCKTSFVISTAGKIESWHHEGNNCISN